MHFEKYLKNKITPIQREIKKTLLVWQKDVVKKAPRIKDLAEVLLESNQGGKHIRGALVHLGYDLYAKNKSQEINKIAAAYEILHTSLLIHDDVIDKSSLRRGKKTVVEQLGADHYGISQTICLGDVGFFLATQLMNSTAFTDSIKVKVLSQFSQIVLDTLLGEMLDIKLANKMGKMNELHIIKIAQLKTADYTITGPLTLGAILAGANTKQLAALALFGNNLGIAYQIKDDILGIFGDEKIVGKSVTSDIEEGKNTLLLVHALRNASEEQKKVLLHTYGQGKITPEQHKTIKQIFEDTGAFAYAQKKVQAYRDTAQNTIASLTSDKTYKSLLRDFIIFLTARQK